MGPWVVMPHVGRVGGILTESIDLWDTMVAKCLI